MNERNNCPKCGRILKFIWPSPQDADVEAVIGRFQRCDVCMIQMDVIAQQQYTISRIGDVLFIDQRRYASIRQWLTAIGLIEA